MKQLLFCAALVGMIAPAQAQNGFSFDINGQHVHIGVPKHCDNEGRCVSITTGKPGESRGKGDEQQIDASKLRDIFSGFMSKGSHEDDETSEPAPKPTSRRAPKPGTSADIAPNPTVETPAAPTQAAPAQIAPAPVVEAPAHPLPAAGSLRPSTAGIGPAVTPPPGETPNSVAALPPSTTEAPAPAQPAAPAPVTAAPAAVPPVAAPGPVAAIPPAEEQAVDSPAGIWVTQNKEGRVHIVPCGVNFCGYVVDAHSAHDGAKVLIDMKQVKDGHWSGHVHDPKGGGTYDATMSLKNADTLAIRGCAMGGLICRGQTWVRG